MDPLTCFLEANPNVKQLGEIAYNGCILPIIAFSSITDFTDLHWMCDASEYVYIEELGNTGEYVAIDVTK